MRPSWYVQNLCASIYRSLQNHSLLNPPQSAILASMRECRQTQVIHRYLFAKVKDLCFLLRLSHDIHQSLVATGLGKTAEHLGMARLLSWVLYDLAQELKRRRCSTVILRLHHACLEMKPRRNRARHAATANEALQRLLDHLNRAILQNIHDTKMILLITELTGDFA